MFFKVNVTFVFIHASYNGIPALGIRQTSLLALGLSYYRSSTYHKSELAFKYTLNSHISVLHDYELWSLAKFNVELKISGNCGTRQKMRTR